MKVLTTLILISSVVVPACIDSHHSGEIVAQSTVTTASLTATPDLAAESLRDDGLGLLDDTVTKSRVLTGTTYDPLLSQKPELLSELEVPPSLVQSVVDRALQLEADVLVPVAVELAEVEFDFSRFSDANEAQIGQLVDERRAALEPSQEPLIRWLTENGATHVKTHWVTNSVDALVPAGLIATLAARSEVKRVDESVPMVPLTSAWSGLESRNGTFVSHLISAGKTGECCGRMGTQVLIGIFDQGATMDNHPAWRDCASSACATRLRGQRYCIWQYGCFPMYYGSWPGSNHGHQISHVAVGSIEQGQDPNHTTAIERVKRSGHTNESEFYFYHAGGTGEMHHAYAYAITSGVDIVNISQGAYLLDCDRFADGQLNVPMGNALNAGILTVAAAGNGGHAGGCNVAFPAFRTETLGVGALETGVGHQSTPYGSVNIAGLSARGGLTVRLHSGGYVTTSGIDLVAPGVLHYGSEEPYSSSPPPNYIEPPAGPLSGTSIAAPAVTGAAAGLLDAFHDIGWTTTDKKALLVNMLLMTDHWDAVTNSYRTVGLSSLSGAGRLRMHYPSSNDLVGPWGWGWRAFTIHQGETVSWTVGDSGPESANITHWKWAALWIESNLDSVADIDFKVVDTCPAGGGEVVIAADSSYSLRARFDLFQPQIGGRCLEMRAYGYSVPSGGRIVYSADYYHSGNPNEH